MRNDEQGGYSGTDFSQFTHEQLVQMFNRENHTQVGHAASRLTDVGNRIEQAAKTLKTFMTSLDPEDWDGEARVQFDAWTTGLINTARGIADGVKSTGKAVQDVADKMAATQIPPFNTADKTYVDQMTSIEGSVGRSQAAAMDPVGAAKMEQELTDKATKLDKDRNEAITALQALSSTYAAQADVINKIVLPEFGPPPNVHNVSLTELGFDSGGSGGGSAAGAPASKGSGTKGVSVPEGGSDGQVATKTGEPAVTGVPFTGSVADPSVVDGVISQPSAPPANFELSGSSALATADQGQLASAAPVDTVPNTGQGTTSGSGPIAGKPPVPGIAGGTSFVPGTGGGTAKSFGGPRIGGSSAYSPGAARPGGVPGAREVTTRPGGPSRGPSSGIVGGTPAHGSGTGGRMPTTGGGVGGIGPSAGTSGRMAPRLATGHAGGPVGGGANAAASRRTFSPGGTGLRAGANDESERTRRQRADYLEEDEETWGGNGRPPVPPVID